MTLELLFAFGIILFCFFAIIYAVALLSPVLACIVAVALVIGVIFSAQV